MSDLNQPTAFLTYKDFAYETRCSESSVRKRVRNGELCAVRQGRSVRIPRSELERLTDEGRTQMRRLARSRLPRTRAQVGGDEQ